MCNNPVLANSYFPVCVAVLEDKENVINGSAGALERREPFSNGRTNLAHDSDHDVDEPGKYNHMLWFIGPNQSYQTIPMLPGNCNLTFNA